MTDDERVNQIDKLAHELVSDSFINQALARYTHQIVQFMYDEYIGPLRDRAEKAERERDEWREHHDRADHRAFAYAQEIERLKDPLDAFRRQGEIDALTPLPVPINWKARAEVAERERDALREALKRIADYKAGDTSTMIIARDALEAKP